MVVGAGVLEVRDVGVLAVDDADVLELGVVELRLKLELAVDDVLEVAGVELELQPIDPQSWGVKLYPKLHSTA